MLSIALRTPRSCRTCGLVVALSVLLSGAFASSVSANPSSETAMASAPPSFRDPLARALALRSPKAAVLATAYKALLAGDMTAFALIARAVLAGRSLPAAGAGDTPAARFFRQLLHETPAADRDAFLTLGLQGQVSNVALLERSPRVPLAASPPAVALLQRYLAAFENPLRSPDPKALLGEHMATYDRYPHPMFVRIAGDLGMADAVPHLERFLRLQRRFYRLQTDYTTHPVEVDTLFRESLRALLRIAELTPAMAANVRTIVQRAETQAASEEGGDPLYGTGEPITLETYNDNQGTAPPSVNVTETRLRGHEQIRSKRQLLKQAALALAGDRAAAASLGTAQVRKAAPLPVPGAPWVFESDAGQAAVSGATLFVVTRQFVEGQHRLVLWSLDLRSGRSRFVVRLLGPADKSGADSELDIRGLCVDPDGSPVLLSTEFVRPGERESSILRFDAASGEVSAILPLAVSGTADPALLACDAHGYLLRRGTVLFRQRLSGELAFRHAMSAEAKLAVGEAEAVVLEPKGLHIFEAGAVAPRRFAIADLLGEKTLPSQAFPLALPDGFALAHGRDDRLLIFDRDGRIRSETKLPQGAGPVSIAGDASSGRAMLGRDQLWVVGSDARIHKFKTPLNVREVVINPVAAYVTDGRSHVEHRLQDGSHHPLQLPGTPHMAKILTATPDWIVVAVYRDGYYLAAIPR